jgi:choline kinase
MKAIIMAAGRATRMLPLTKDTPKCLLKINDRTILQHQVDVLRKCGIKDIVVVAGHRSEKIEDACGKELKVLFNPFDLVSGMIMSLWIAKDELTDDALVIYSDVLFVEEIIKKLLECKGDVSLAVDGNQVDLEAEKVKIKDGFVTKVSKTNIGIENSDGEFIGLAKFKKKSMEAVIEELDSLARSNINAYLIDLIMKIIDRGVKVSPCDITGKLWLDIDFPEDLENARKVWKGA